MRCLELFAGTKSVGKVASELGWEVVSVDISNKYKPDICEDVLKWDYTVFPKGHFDFIWASPPCQLYSIAPSQLFTSEQREERAERGNEVSRRTREIIDYFQPKWVAIENPHSSALWKQGIFDYPKVKVSYCKYGFPYRKNTYICTNIPFQGQVCRGDCGFVRQVQDAQGKMHFHHLEVAKQGVSAHCRGLNVQCTTHRRDDLYRIPEPLIRDIFAALE